MTNHHFEPVCVFGDWKSMFEGGLELEGGEEPSSRYSICKQGGVRTGKSDIHSYFFFQPPSRPPPPPSFYKGKFLSHELPNEHHRQSLEHHYTILDLASRSFFSYPALQAFELQCVAKFFSPAVCTSVPPGHSNVLSELNSFAIMLSPFRQFHALSECSNITSFSFKFFRISYLEAQHSVVIWENFWFVLLVLLLVHYNEALHQWIRQ